jgi:hypothetical protein
LVAIKDPEPKLVVPESKADQVPVPEMVSEVGSILIDRIGKET